MPIRNSIETDEMGRTYMRSSQQEHRGQIDFTYPNETLCFQLNGNWLNSM